ncbi:hypothetical protein DITRI_Ditri13aG0154700 [Diplodiscus trichospermus]
MPRHAANKALGPRKFCSSLHIVMTAAIKTSPSTMKNYLCSFHGFLEVLKKKSPQTQSPELLESKRLADLPEDTCHHFSLAEIKAATNNFHPDSIIGDGWSGFVYEGIIDGGIMAAVKRRNDGLQEAEEFRNEVQMLCQLRHSRFISLIGFCHEENEMILVYEYMSRGSLSNYLFGEADVLLGWKQRLQICIGVARGLHYLHTGAKRVIFHRDLKCWNIFVDDEGYSKISNFAFSKMGPPSMSKTLLKMD